MAPASPSTTRCHSRPAQPPKSCWPTCTAAEPAATAYASTRTPRIRATAIGPTVSGGPLLQRQLGGGFELALGRVQTRGTADAVRAIPQALGGVAATDALLEVGVGREGSPQLQLGTRAAQH